MKYATHHHTPMPALALLWLALLLIFNGPAAQAQMPSGDVIRFKTFSTEGSMWMPNWCYSGPIEYGYTNGLGARMKCTFDLSQFAQQWGFMDDNSKILGTNYWAVSDESNTGPSYMLAMGIWTYLNGSGEIQSWFSSYYNGGDIYPISNIMGQGNLPGYGLSNVASQIDLVLVGPTGSTKDVLVKFEVSATDVDSNTRIPDADITLAGKHPTNGVVWAKFTDNTTNDCTPAINGHDNYVYNVEKTAARLSIELGGTDISGQTLSTFPNSADKIFVGSWISLSVELDNPIGTITNYNWTLPGDKVITFIQNATYGGPIMFPALGNSNSNPQFAWYSAGTNTVECEIMVGGQSVKAHATLVVSSPNVNVDIVLGDVAMDTNYGLAVNAPWIHFGTGNFATGAGIQFNRNTNGELSMGQCMWVQLIDRSITDTETNGTQHPLVGRGLDHIADESEEYPEGQVDDSPGWPVHQPAMSTSLVFGANTFLMWTPPGCGCPVPLWRTDWSWSATGNKSTGSWILLNSSKTLINNEATTGYPSWESDKELHEPE